mgnify:CR=1 FL=1
MSTPWIDTGTEDDTALAGDDAVAEVTRYFARGAERLEITYAAERIVTGAHTAPADALTTTSTLADGRAVAHVSHLTPVHPYHPYFPNLGDVIITLDTGEELRVPHGTVLAMSEVVRWDVSETTHYYEVDAQGEPDDSTDSYDHEWIGYTVIPDQEGAERLMRRTATSLSASSLP